MTKQRLTDSDIQEEIVSKKFEKLKKTAGLRPLGGKNKSPTKVSQKSQDHAKGSNTKGKNKEPIRCSPRKSSKNIHEATAVEQRKKKLNDSHPRKLFATSSKSKRPTPLVEEEEESDPNYIEEEEDSQCSEDEEFVPETEFTPPPKQSKAPTVAQKPVATPSDNPAPTQSNSSPKIEIMVFRDSFEPDVTKDINNIITSCWRGPHINWNQVPVDVRDLWWEEFAAKFQWAKQLENDVNKLFKKKCASKIRNVVSRAKVSLKKPAHVCIEDWTIMKERFEDPKYKAKCEKVKVFRSKYNQQGGSTYCGGSTSAHEHRRRLEMKLKRPASVLEVFNVTHKKKEGSYSGSRAREVVEIFDRLKSEQIAKGEDSGEMKTDEELWVEATGGPVNGRVFGLGFVGRGRNYQMGSSAAEIVSLRKIVSDQEVLIGDLQEHAKEMVVHKAGYESTIQSLHQTLQGILVHLHDPTRPLPNLNVLAADQPQPAMLQLEDPDETQP